MIARGLAADAASRRKGTAASGSPAVRTAIIELEKYTVPWPSWCTDMNASGGDSLVNSPL